MRCKVVKIISALLLLSLVSCRVEMPKDVPSPDKMEAVLYDYHLAQTMASTMASSDYKEKLLYRNVFEKHGMTKEVFDSALVWYNRHPKYMMKIYKNLESRLQYEVDVLSSLRSTREVGVDINFAHLSSNISELWTSHNVKMLSSVPLNNKLAFSFTTPKDSSFVAGDSLVFSFNVMFIPKGETGVERHAHAAINYEFSDKTTGFQWAHVKAPGHYELRVPRNFKSRLKSMNGYVFYSDNDTTYASRVVVSDISLRRIHPVQSNSSSK